MVCGPGAPGVDFKLEASADDFATIDNWGTWVTADYTCDPFEAIALSIFHGGAFLPGCNLFDVHLTGASCEENAEHGFAAVGPMFEGLPESPSLITQAKTLASASAKWAAAGFPVRSAEEKKAALAICDDCPHKRGSRCKICGCNLPAKVAMATEACPLKKWPGDHLIT